ncbi:MAG: YggS family pyridoxal phosphate-dependent enzyme [Deltaproteobacteria bacterium]|nr:MAG: YggS family pyridoxal phosphate-dependent enzyme [Deltaproteobacteria bacterium]
MTAIQDNLETVNRKIKESAEKSGRKASGIKLVAVSKRFPAEAVQEAIKAGHFIFGENYLQEAAQKFGTPPDPLARLHFIGHLQSNKAKTAAAISHTIETVDSLKLAAALNKHLLGMGKLLDILIQVNIGADPDKSGVMPEETEDLLLNIRRQNLSCLRVCGLMTMPPRTAEPEAARPHFRNLANLAGELAARELFADNQKVELSMGMSGDYHVAIEEGATIVRVGTAIFGQRPVLIT